MMRLATHVVTTGIALALLGVLVLLSTSVDDGARRQTDLNLRQLRDVDAAIEREALNARNMQIDNGATLQGFAANLRTSIDAVGRDLTVLFPATPDLSRRIRAVVEAGFNSIDPRRRELADAEPLARKFAELDQSADRLLNRVEAFRQNQTRYLRAASALTTDGRELVQGLRERGQRTAADMLFRGIGQVLDRAQRGAETDLVQIETIVNRLAADTKLSSSEDRSAFLAMIENMRTLVPARRAVETNLSDIVGGRFEQQVSALRELVTRDTLYRLTTVNDSRVLLNVYTVLLLLVLGYFGVRLQLSYRALNRSHADLAQANASLEARVRKRTQDMERAYEELKESQVQLVQAEKMSSLGQLVAGIVHEINTPLLYVLNNATVTAENVEELRGCISASSELATLVRDGGAAAPALQDALDRLVEHVGSASLGETIDEIVALAHDSTDGLNQISELVQSLKDFSRLDRAAEDHFDVREGLDKTLLITRNLLKYGVTVDKQFDAVPKILCAPSRINQVFINLVTNAVQAMDGKGRLTIATRARDGWVDVCVTDTGCGIAPEHIDKIMDPFFTTKPVGQGTGLGLSIVRRIVDEHGGRIAVDSKVGAGTTITVSLPVDGRAAVTARAAA
jgi:two-component system, NtrC family, sensor kinase